MQLSSVDWLRYGDRNTALFQAFAAARRKRNYIKKLKDNNGDIMEGMADLNPHIQGYFASLFTSAVQHTDPALLQKVHRKVTEQMNTILMAPFYADDVRKAVFSIGDLKAPGPDRLHAVFYKKFWPILGDDLVRGGT